MRVLIALVIVLLLACGLLAYLLLRERSGGAAWRRKGLFIPQRLPTGDTLEHLVRRFQHLTNSALLGRRLARLYAVLFDPDLILEYINDTYLTPQIETGNLINNTALFLCVAAVEEAIEARSFGETPNNTVGSYLRAEFKRRGWIWPTHPLAWKKFFLEQYVDQLLNEPSNNARVFPPTGLPPRTDNAPSWLLA